MLGIKAYQCCMPVTCTGLVCSRCSVRGSGAPLKPPHSWADCVFSFKKLTCTMWDKGWQRSQLHPCGTSSTLWIGWPCLCCQLPAVVFPQLGGTSQNLPDAPFAPSDSNGTVQFLEGNPFCSALDLCPSGSPLLPSLQHLTLTPVN